MLANTAEFWRPHEKKKCIIDQLLIYHPAVRDPSAVNTLIQKT